MPYRLAQVREDRSGFDDTLTNCIADEFCTGMQVQLVHNVLTMSCHGLGTDDEGLGNFCIVGALSQISENFLLAFGEVGSRLCNFCIGPVSAEKITY